MLPDMKRISFVFLILLSPLLFSVFAQELQSRESVVLPKGSTVNQDYFASGESVTLAGTVNGDAYIAGGNITVPGTVNGDLLVAGGTITVAGTVAGDVRAAGGQIIITGNIEGNVTTGGGSVTITNSARLGGSLVAGAGSLSIMGPVERGMTIGAGSVQLSNTIGGNVLAGVGRLTLTPDAVIQGNLTYYSKDKAEIQQGAQVVGNVNMQQIKEKDKKAPAAVALATFIPGLLYLISLFIMGLLFLRFLPIFTQDTTNLVGREPWKSLGVGLLILILTPIVVVLLMVTVIGIPIGLVLFAAYLIYFYLSVMFVAIFIGKKILRQNGKTRAGVLALSIGLIIYGIISLIPIIGGLFTFLVMLIGMGALFIQKRNYYLNLRSKKIL